jgi:hypothetical protein
MRPYGMQRTPELEFPDVADSQKRHAHHEGRKISSYESHQLSSDS